MSNIYDGFISFKRTNSDGVKDTYTFWLDDGVTETISVTAGSGIQSIIAEDDSSQSFLVTFDDGVKMKLPSAQTSASAIYDTASGTVATFSDGGEGVPLKSLKVSIEPVQSGSGDPSPSNVRPITGWTGATISHSGEDTTNPETLTISWQTEAGTVYGGTLDVGTGVLTVTRATVDLGTLTWTKNAFASLTVGYYFQTTVSSKKQMIESINSNYRTAPYKSISNLISFEGAGVDHVAIEAGGETAYRIIDSSYSDETAFTSAMNGVQYCYYLATPLTYQLTPAQLTTLLGENRIWADTGNIVNVEYRADTKLYVDGKIAAYTSGAKSLIAGIEAEMKATANYSEGDLLIVGDKLYVATASIASGGSITEGTNVTSTTVAEQLALKANAES